MAEASVGELVKNLMSLLKDRIIPLLFALATVIFIWGVIQYIIAGGSEDRAKNAKQIIVWGIIGLTVMVSAWAIVNILCGTLVSWGGTTVKCPS